MDALGNYILSLTAAAIFIGILQALLDRKSGSHTLLRFVGGIFLTFAVIAPITDIDLNAVLDIPLDYIRQGDALAAKGQQITHDQQRDIIKQQCEAYILDKASDYRIDPKVEVMLQDETLIPMSVCISGNVTPYAKKSLAAWLENEMGIPRENQLWTG